MQVLALVRGGPPTVSYQLLAAGVALLYISSGESEARVAWVGGHRVDRVGESDAGHWWHGIDREEPPPRPLFTSGRVGCRLSCFLLAAPTPTASTLPPPPHPPPPPPARPWPSDFSAFQTFTSERGSEAPSPPTLHALARSLAALQAARQAKQDPSRPLHCARQSLLVSRKCCKCAKFNQKVLAFISTTHNPRATRSWANTIAREEKQGELGLLSPWGSVRPT